MKKNWTKIAIALGPVMIISAVVWEVARTNPDYNFLIEPWAIRGTETDHGEVFIVVGVLLLIGGLLAAWEKALNNTVSASIAAYFVLAATGFTYRYAAGESTIELTAVANVVLSFIIASSLSMSLRSLFGERLRLFKRALPIGLLVFVVFFLLFRVSIQGNSYTLRPWLLVFFVSLLFAGLSITIKPMNMAANRMLILAAVAGWTLVVLSAGALRQTLVSIQESTVQSNGAVGVAAQYKDTQAAGGWWLAGLGATILFVGAVGLWAKRRDVVAAIARAR
ncbi:MAG: hypothetical protein ACR2N2_01535, partial [Acidimicrobiia bacterium]